MRSEYRNKRKLWEISIRQRIVTRNIRDIPFVFRKFINNEYMFKKFSENSVLMQIICGLISIQHEVT